MVEEGPEGRGREKAKNKNANISFWNFEKKKTEKSEMKRNELKPFLDCLENFPLEDLI